jgi:hypothetical protein
MILRKDDMSNWTCSTRRYADFEQAMEFALAHTPHKPEVTIWPMGAAWIVIIFTSAMVN